MKSNNTRDHMATIRLLEVCNSYCSPIEDVYINNSSSSNQFADT